MGILKNRIRTFFSKPQNVILIIFGIMLTFSTVAPVIAIIKDTLQIHPGTIDQHLTGKASGYSIVNYTDNVKSLETTFEYNASGGSDMYYFNSLWWFFRVSDY